MNKPVVGVDLGGTNIKLGLISPDGEVLERNSTETRAERGPEAVAGRICDAVLGLLARAGLDRRAVAGVGIGSPGTIDLQAGVVTFSPNLPGWHDVPLRRLVEEGTELGCVLDNDANAAALAESWVGAGRGKSSLILLTLGTGIGGGIVLDGRIWHGGNGVAGEIGHMSIDPDGPECGCGNRGCLEAFASATGMVRRMKEAIEKGEKTSLADQAETLTARRIHEAAEAGDQAARRTVQMTGRYLGIGVSNLMHILNPEVIAFSGGMTGAGRMLMDPLLEEADWRTMEAPRRDVKICFAELPEDAGIIGAARCLMLA